jgi:adenine-specific DNA methylase
MMNDSADNEAPPGAPTAKTLGAFYTDTQVADFLVWWAIRSPHDTVMDPSFGGGVFLRSACERLLQLGGDPADQVSGVEVDPAVHARIAEKLADEFGVCRERLRLSDFFQIPWANVPKVEVIVGNPPFIRYQRFTGEVRKVALARSAAAGVRLPELCSSWAPFLVHSAATLRPGGRLAMVVPMEIAHAAYARPVLDYLRSSFGKSTFLTFRKKLFPDLSEDTLLLLAEDKGATPTGFLWRDLSHPGVLAGLRDLGRLPL